MLSRDRCIGVDSALHFSCPCAAASTNALPPLFCARTLLRFAMLSRRTQCSAYAAAISSASRASAPAPAGGRPSLSMATNTRYALATCKCSPVRVFSAHTFTPTSIELVNARFMLDRSVTSPPGAPAA